MEGGEWGTRKTRPSCLMHAYTCVFRFVSFLFARISMHARTHALTHASAHTLSLSDARTHTHTHTHTRHSTLARTQKHAPQYCCRLERGTRLQAVTFRRRPSTFWTLLAPSCPRPHHLIHRQARAQSICGGEKGGGDAPVRKYMCYCYVCGGCTLAFHLMHPQTYFRVGMHSHHHRSLCIPRQTADSTKLESHTRTLPRHLATVDNTKSTGDTRSFSGL